MANKKRIIEWLKSLIIALLAVNAVFLMGKTGLFSEFIESSEPLSRIVQWVGSLSRGKIFIDNGSADITLGEAARPLCIAVTKDGGMGRYGVKYDTALIDEIYGKIGLLLGEALGSSGIPEAISESGWQSALMNPGVYFDFVNPLPLSVLSAWLGTEITHGGTEHSARRFCLSENGEGGMDLYYISESDGDKTFYRCQTALTYSGIAARVEDYSPNGSAFIFELGALLNSADAYTLILQDSAAKAFVSASNPIGSLTSVDTLLTGFDLSPYIVSGYSEPDGTLVFVENDCNLRLGTDGTVVYKRTASESSRLLVEAAGNTASLTEIIECARKLVSDTMGTVSGQAVIYLTEHSYSDGVYTLNFSFYIGGAQINLSGGTPAATIIISGGGVAEARLRFRTYSALPDTKMLLPELQAASIIASTNPGGDLTLNYTDTGGEAVLDPYWSVR